MIHVHKNQVMSICFIFQIPKGFPYFAVDFGTQGGYAHVIEDERQFPKYFGKVYMFLCIKDIHIDLLYN